MLTSYEEIMLEQQPPTIVAPPPLFTYSRHMYDIEEIESLARLVLELPANLTDPILSDAFERLVELAGTRDFLPSVASLHQYLFGIKLARLGSFGIGYIVSWYAIASLNDHVNRVCAEEAIREAKLRGLGAGAGPPSLPGWPMNYAVGNDQPDPFDIEVDLQEFVKMGLARLEIPIPGGHSHIPSSAFASSCPYDIGPHSIPHHSPQGACCGMVGERGDCKDSSVFVKFVSKTTADQRAAEAYMQAQTGPQYDSSPCLFSRHPNGGAGQTTAEVALNGPMEIQVVTDWTEEMNSAIHSREAPPNSNTTLQTKPTKKSTQKSKPLNRARQLILKAQEAQKRKPRKRKLSSSTPTSPPSARNIRREYNHGGLARSHTPSPRFTHCSPPTSAPRHQQYYHHSAPHSPVFSYKHQMRDTTPLMAAAAGPLVMEDHGSFMVEQGSPMDGMSLVLPHCKT